MNPGTNVPSGFVYSRANPLLGPLADHGGGLKTYSLLPGSPAIQAGSQSYLAFPGPTDARGLPRMVGGTIDIGASSARGMSSRTPTTAVPARSAW